MGGLWLSVPWNCCLCCCHSIQHVWLLSLKGKMIPSNDAYWARQACLIALYVNWSFLQTWLYTLNYYLFFLQEILKKISKWTVYLKTLLAFIFGMIYVLISLLPVKLKVSSSSSSDKNAGFCVHLELFLGEVLSSLRFLRCKQWRHWCNSDGWLRP